jgi:hypothetical protein
LVDGEVRSPQADYWALYKHAEKLDAIARSLGLPSFLGICDTTDQKFNTEDRELPSGMTSTNELMAVQGVWMPLADAVRLLQALRDHVVGKQVRFGILGNQHAQVVGELESAIAFVVAHAGQAEKFNFAVVT